jgi:hypothetical protein
VPYARNLNPEWGYLASPSVMRTARLIALATIIGAIVGAATVFSLLDRPVAEESVAARTLVAPDSKRAVITSTSVAVQQPTKPQQVKTPAAVQNEQKAPSARGAPSLPGELATTSPQRPTSAAALAEAPAVKTSPSAQTFNDTIAVEPAPKLQSKKPRVASRTAAPRYGASGYDGYFDRPRYGYEPSGPRYGSGSFAWAPNY